MRQDRQTCSVQSAGADVPALHNELHQASQTCAFCQPVVFNCVLTRCWAMPPCLRSTPTCSAKRGW